MPAVAQLTSLVTAEEIRSILGVSTKELPDAKIGLPVYLRTLKLAVGRLDSARDLWGAFAALPEDSLSDEQEKFLDAFLGYTAWKAASLFAVSLPQLSPKSVTDGKAGFQRQADAPADTLANIAAQLSQSEADLIDAGAALLPVDVTPVSASSLFARASFGSVDPITG